MKPGLRCCATVSVVPSLCLYRHALWLILQSFAREQILGVDQRPLVVLEGKTLKERHPKREVPPDAPIIDVS